MNIGDIGRIKITGETVQIIVNISDTRLLVFRALTTRDGLRYEEIEVPKLGIEPVEANIQREFEEAIFRHKLMSGKLEGLQDVTEGLPEILN